MCEFPSGFLVCLVVFFSSGVRELSSVMCSEVPPSTMYILFLDFMIGVDSNVFPSLKTFELCTPPQAQIIWKSSIEDRPRPSSCKFFLEFCQIRSPFFQVGRGKPSPRASCPSVRHYVRCLRIGDVKVFC